MSIKIYVDIETTGRRSPGTHIVEVGFVVLDAHWKEIEAFGSLAHPGEEGIRTASPEAMAVNGITPEMLRQAPPAAEVAARLNAALDQHWGATVHAFNNEFDMWFLARPPWNIRTHRWGECVMLAAHAVMEKAGALEKHPYFKKAKWPRLAEAAGFFGVPYGNGHQALDDARTASRVHREILIRREMEPADEEVNHLFDSGL